MSISGVCTLGELEAAAGMMNADFDGDISVVYARNGQHGLNWRDRWTFTPDGTVPRGVAVAVTMRKEGYETRTVGRFRVVEGGTD
jgi:hypothetical protein